MTTSIRFECESKQLKQNKNNRKSVAFETATCPEESCDMRHQQIKWQHIPPRAVIDKLTSVQI